MKLNIIGTTAKVGFGTHCKGMLKSLDNIGVDISFMPIGNLEEEDSELYKKITSNQFDPDGISLYIFHDAFLTQRFSKTVIMFYVFETTIISDHVKNKIENYVDILFTSTEKHKDILLKNGITKPIYVIHEGIDPELFNINNNKKLIETNNYTYLILGKSEKRKNTNKVFASFFETMQYENVSLIAHTYNHRHEANIIYNWFDFDLKDFGYRLIEDNDLYLKYYNSFSTIYLTKPKLTDEQMTELYNSANIGLSYSSAEGWGLPEMEMMTCGKPVIITNVLGHNEYINNIPIYKELIIEPIGTELAKDMVYFDGSTGYWSKLNISALKEKLIYTYKHNIGSIKSEILSDYFKNNFSWHNAAITLKQILTEEI